MHFEIRIFSFNSYVYYLTRVFNLTTRAFNLATRAFTLLASGFELVAWELELVTAKLYLANVLRLIIKEECDRDLTCSLDTPNKIFPLKLSPSCYL